MALDEVTITKAIVESYMESFLNYTDVDVALVGAGPANLVAAKKLAEADAKTVIFERNLSVGGGIWGGGGAVLNLESNGCSLTVLLGRGGAWHGC